MPRSLRLLFLLLCYCCCSWTAPSWGSGKRGPSQGEPFKAPCQEKACTSSSNPPPAAGAVLGLLRGSGEACGVYTPGCAPGLRCAPRPGERAPLQALLRGKGLCKDAAGGAAAAAGAAAATQAAAAAAAGENHGADHFTPQPLPLQSQDPLQEAPVGKAQMEQLSLNSDAKEDLDTAPCRMHLAAIMQELKAPLYLDGQDIFIPNCDTKGFYRLKQCLASKGQKRGQCWCVDKRGRRLEGLDANPLCLLANSD